MHLPLKIDLSVVPDRPSGLGIEVPGDTWWEGQRETIAEIVALFKTHRYVLAGIPTGGGKTIVATAVHRILDGKSLFLTHTKQLQGQYLKQAKWAEVAMGRNNYKCLNADSPFVGLYGRQLNAEECGNHNKRCIFPNRCEYPQMLKRASQNPQVVMNYAYALRLLRAPLLKLGTIDEPPEEEDQVFEESIPNPFRRDFLVCDEGHLLENAIVEAASLSISYRSCREAKLPPMPYTEDMKLWINWASDALPTMTAYVSSSNQRSKDALASGDTNVVRLAQMHLSARRLKEQLLQLANVDSSWIVYKGSNAVTVRPLWAWGVAEAELFQYFRRVLIMSATPGDPDLLAKRLGITEPYGYIDRPSIFPIGNRIVFYWPVLSVNRHTSPAEWGTIASAVQFIADQEGLKDKKGLIHTGSFKIAAELGARLQGRFLVHEIPAMRETLLDAFVESDQPLALVSPSFTTGLDYKDIGWQVIVKVPFGNLGDRITKMRHGYALPDDPKFGRKVYDDDALNTVVQAAGRAVRGPEDQGVTYVIDGSFWPLYKRGQAPEFFKEAVRWVRS
jgi:Rad3-related DNA helicase